jgi:type IV conjugative transfer system coupling protein TraD
LRKVSESVSFFILNNEYVVSLSLRLHHYAAIPIFLLNRYPNMQKGPVKQTTQGGQILLHDLHMMGQVLYKLIIWLLPVGLLITAVSFVCMTESYPRYIGWQWLNAQGYAFFADSYHLMALVQPNGRPFTITASQLMATPFVQQVIAILTQKLKQSTFVGLFGYITSTLLVAIWLRRRGHKQIAEKYIKGDYLGTTQEIKKLIQQKGLQSKWTIGTEKLPLPLSFEMQHLLFHGTTGSGKSTGIKAFLDLIRIKGDRAIIYDKSCNLVELFYDPQKDILMNPLDERTCAWSLWQECREKCDFDNLAVALIPMPPHAQDPFWVSAARTLFAAAAFRLYTQNTQEPPKVLTLLQRLLTADLNDLQALLKGTEAESLISEKAEKTAISIKAVLATYLKSLCYIKEGEQPFSIRKWVQEENATWLFRSSLGDRHESLKPLLTAWLDIAINALLSLSPHPNRRIWVILDELTSLQQLPFLTAALSEARKFGGCFVIGIQSYAQLGKVYGQEGAREISSLLNTRFMFRVPDPEIAEWSARNLGQTTLEEVREGISYGANSIRDGVSIHYVEQAKPVVNGSDILRLADLSCYVRLVGSYPITQLHFPYINRPSKNVPFEARTFKQDSLREDILNLTDNMQKQKSVPTTKQNISEKSKNQEIKQPIDEWLFE